MGQGGRGGARERGSIERRAQPHEPQAGGQRLHPGLQPLGGAANLALDQIARHGAARVSFRNDRAEPSAGLRTLRLIKRDHFIHRLLTSRFSECG